jgi:hypothetical protein
MGVGRRSKSLAEFAAKSQGYASVGLPMANRKAVEAAALLMTQAARASIAAGSGGDSALSNVGRRGGGAKVGARYDVKGTENATALVRATGPLHLLDNPTRPHRITSKVRKGRSRASRESFYNAIFGGGSGFGGAKPLRTPYGPRYSVQHPGTSGKRTFFRAVERAEPMVRFMFRSEHTRQMRRYWA